MENIRRDESTICFKTALEFNTGSEFALIGAFNFSKTKQTFEYWWNISEQYFDK